MFKQLSVHRLNPKLSKCQFLRCETKYLSFIISRKGIKPDLDKVEVIGEMFEPKIVKQMM